MGYHIEVVGDNGSVVPDVIIDRHTEYCAPDIPEINASSELQLGIMTRTAVPSPVIRRIYQGRVRSPDHNDIIYIGDHFIQVNEMRPDGQLYEVARKDDFDQRIQHSVIFGTYFEPSCEDEAAPDFPPLEVPVDAKYVSPSCSAFVNSDNVGDLPPQMVLLVLEGELVFLFLALNGDNLEFKFTKVPLPRNDSYPAEETQVMNLSIDPKSRYLAVSYVASGFCVMQLEPWDVLNQRWKEQAELSPVKSLRVRATNNYVMHIDFLHPDNGYRANPIPGLEPIPENMRDPDLVILMLVLVRKRVARYTTYDWKNNESLKDALSARRVAHSVDTEYQMPVMIIPLTVRMCFCIVTETKVAVCDGLAHGSPQFRAVGVLPVERTDWFNGQKAPICTAWSRPVRTETFYQKRDNIYLGREDGVVNFVEFSADSVVTVTVAIGSVSLETSIDTAFSCVTLGFDDHLILGGDCGNGSVWSVPPRTNAKLQGYIPNWAPALDMASTDNTAQWDKCVSNNGRRALPWYDTNHSISAEVASNGLFTASCKGSNGALTEHRVGIPATIVADQYHPLVRQTWVVPEWISPISGNDGPDVSDAIKIAGGEPQPFYVLASSRDQSNLLMVSTNKEGYRHWDTAKTDFFDLMSRTLDVAYTEERTVYQVTERSIVMYSDGARRLIDLSEIIDHQDVFVSSASISQDYIVLAANAGIHSELVVIRIAGLEYEIIGNVPTPGEITCLHIGHINGNDYVFAGLQRDMNTVSMALYKINDGGLMQPPAVEYKITRDVTPPTEPVHVEAFYSIKQVYMSDRSTVLVGGTRAGFVVSITLDSKTLKCLCLSVKRIGVLPTSLSILPSQHKPGKTCLLAVSDSTILLMDDYTERVNGQGEFRRIAQVLPKNAFSLDLHATTIHTVTLVPKGIPSSCSDNFGIIMVIDNKLVFAELATRIQPVPRQCKTQGAPKRIIYSQFLNCLIVSVVRENRAFLRFMDTQTGKDLTYPVSSDERTQTLFVNGLGVDNDRILCLREWVVERGRQRWVFILVGTKSGRLLVIKAVREEDPGDPSKQRVRCWLHFRLPPGDSPIFSIYTRDDNIFYGCGTKLEWIQLDAEKRSIVPRAQAVLDKPIAVIDGFRGRIAVMTNGHMMVYYAADHSNGEYSLRVEKGEVMEGPGSSLFSIGPDDRQEESFPLMLFADRQHDLTGHWNSKCAELTSKTIFRVGLPGVIRKICRAKTQRMWNQRWNRPRFGRIPSSVDDAEVFGLSINGSIQHITLLDIHAWHVLYLMQKMALCNKLICPFTTWVDDHSTKTMAELRPPSTTIDLMHIDGNVLQRILTLQALESVFSTEASRKLLYEYLRGVDKGRWVTWEDGLGTSGDVDRFKDLYFELAYDMLEYYFRPVL